MPLPPDFAATSKVDLQPPPCRAHYTSGTCYHLWNLLPPLKLTDVSRACLPSHPGVSHRLWTLLLPPELADHHTQSLQPPPDLTAASRACLPLHTDPFTASRPYCRPQTLLQPPDLAPTSRSCCRRLQALHQPPDPTSTSKSYRNLQSLLTTASEICRLPGELATPAELTAGSRACLRPHPEASNRLQTFLLPAELADHYTQSLQLLPELTAAFRTCLAPHTEPFTASRPYCRLQALLPSLHLASTSGPCLYLQILPQSPKPTYNHLPVELTTPLELCCRLWNLLSPVKLTAVSKACLLPYPGASHCLWTLLSPPEPATFPELEIKDRMEGEQGEAWWFEAAWWARVATRAWIEGR